MAAAATPNTDPLEPTPLPRAEVVHANVESVECSALVVNLFEGVTTPGGATGAVDRALDGAISELIASGDVTGKLGKVAVLYPRGAIPARRVLVVGLGAREKLSAESVRRAAASSARRALELGATSVHTIAHGAGSGSLGMAAATQATLEGSLLAGYAFRGWKVGDGNKRLEQVTLIEGDESRLGQAQAGLVVARAVAAGVGRARDLVNRPPNHANPRHVAEVARRVAATSGLTCEVGDREWLEREHMGALLAVASGTRNEPAFIVLQHNAERNDLPTVVLVGKGVTFDSGGLSLKSRDGMIPMKGDMAGAAAVIGVMEAAAALNVDLRLVALCPCVENMPDGASYRPSDVVIASNGVSIEILSTDAEGRLALAEALAYARRFDPAAVIDIATLTGSSTVALGAG
ncbi:MAG TPA: M17 family peptidase N-terminal domain-containing protein, partial [Trueperaceae bacterium]|nr:M17 family peptidase N-terminal domain-containing protein [Trueperaceae bacterium]